MLLLLNWRKLKNVNIDVCKKLCMNMSVFCVETCTRNQILNFGESYN